MSLPKWSQKVLSFEDFQQIEDAIKKAEESTSAEIVPVVVRRSSTVGHIPTLLILGLTFLFYLGLVAFDLHMDMIYLGGTIVGALILTRVLSPIEAVERWLTPKGDQAHQVRLRAEKEFHDSSIKKTKDATGILIFISLMERQVVVLADQAISERLPEQTWSLAVVKIIDGIRNKNLGKGLINGIEHCGGLLAEVLPIQADDKNELPNHLILKDM